MVYTPQT
jgi:pre-mRNA-splicing factor ATP-dependent RNA helicase DHX38/PRP16